MYYFPSFFVLFRHWFNFSSSGWNIFPEVLFFSLSPIFNVVIFVQVSSHFSPTTERCHFKCIRSAIRKLNVVEDGAVQMVCIPHCAFPFYFPKFCLVYRFLFGFNDLDFLLPELLIFASLRMLTNFSSCKVDFDMVMCKC